MPVDRKTVKNKTNESGRTYDWEEVREVNLDKKEY